MRRALGIEATCNVEANAGEVTAIRDSAFYPAACCG